MIRNVFYKSYMAVHGYILCISIINFIYCIMFNSPDLFFGAVYRNYIPVLRFLKNGNIIELLLSLLFLGITTISFIFSVEEILDKNNEKAPFTLFNIFWFLIFTNPVFTMIAGDESFDNDRIISFYYIPYIILLFFMVALILVKWNEQNNVMRNKLTYDKDISLPGKFQLSAKNYAQLERTAKGVPIIDCITIVLAIYFYYLDVNLPKSETLLLANIIYGLVVILNIFIFIGVIIDTKHYERITVEEPPCPNFLKKLIKMQLITFVLLIVSYIVFIIVL